MTHSAVGFAELEQPLHGTWPTGGFPDVVELLGKRFRRSEAWSFPYSRVVAQYREDVDRNSMHLMVYDDGTWTIDHTDDANPERGLVLEHVIKDVSGTPLGAFVVAGVAVGVSAALAAALTRFAR